MEAVAPPLWPLHDRLVLERTAQPDSAMLGAPPKFIDTSERPFPWSRLRTHEVSGSGAIAIDVAVTPMDGIIMAFRTDVGTLTVTLPETVPLPFEVKLAVAARPPIDPLNTSVAVCCQFAVPSRA